MALLMANDAFKYPASDIKVNGFSRPLEVFDDAALNLARLEIALEMPSSGEEDRQQAFEHAWNEIHNSSTLPGLVDYNDEGTEKQTLLLAQAFEVSAPPLPPKSTPVPANPPAPDRPKLPPRRRPKRQ